MDNFFKSLKEKLSVDNLVGLVKESKGGKQEEVKKTLEKLDPKNINVDDDKLKIAADETKNDKQKDLTTIAGETTKIVEVTKPSVIANLIKPSKDSMKSNNKKEDADEDESDDIDPMWDI